MNRTLLLILCDFLLLNLLALTRWEKAEPPPPQKPTLSSQSGSSTTKDQDVVDVMRLALEDEKNQRAQLSEQLQTREKTLAEKEQTLASLQGEKQKLSGDLESSRAAAADLSRQFAVASQDARVSKERLAQIQKDLEAREQEAKKQKEQLADLEKQQLEARQKIENLNVAVKVAEQEKSLLRETAETLKTQVEAERQERAKVQETTSQLAQGVGQLAQKSSEITKEIRENRPISANVLFNDFLNARVAVKTSLSRDGLFGSIDRSGAADTILVTDGKDTYALAHVDETPMGGREPAADWKRIEINVERGAVAVPATLFHFLSLDPRVIAVPMDAAAVTRLGAKVYSTALDPYKFADAVLINREGKGYGEVAFKVDPEQPGYVRMDNRLFKRLFGDFAPSRGDLVVSRTGEILGVMVTSDYCAVINNFLPSKTVRTGTEVPGQKTEDILNYIALRIRALPFRLQ